VDISLDFVVDAARRRLATLTPEVAGYVVLLAARELEFRPRRVSAATLTLAEGGEVHVQATEPAESAEVEVALRGLLATLVGLTPSPAPAISAVAERRDGIGLPAFAAELAAALIPINHAAAGRALARLYRESQRARASGFVAPLAGSSEPSAVAGTRHAPPDSSRSVESPRSVDSSRSVESPRSVDSSRSVESPRSVELPRAVPGHALAEPELGAPQPEPELLEIDVELDTDLAESGPAAQVAPSDGQPSAAAVDGASPFEPGLSRGKASAASEDAPERLAFTPAPSEVEPAPIEVAPAPIEVAPAPTEPSLEVPAAEPEAIEVAPAAAEPNLEAHAAEPEATELPVALEPRSEPRHEAEPIEPALTPAATGVAPLEPAAAASAPFDRQDRRDVLVPAPAAGLAAREREMVVPMAIVDAAPPGPFTEAASDVLSSDPREPLLVHPLDAIDAFARGGFARVSWPSLPPANADLAMEDCRSDLQHLLAAFLAEARSEARMTQGLRRLLGLESASNGISRSHP